MPKFPRISVKMAGPEKKVVEHASEVGEASRPSVTVDHSSETYVDTTARVAAALAHAILSQGSASGQYRQPHRWTVRIVDESDNVIRIENWCVGGESYLQPRVKTSTGSSSGMTFPACLHVTSDTASRSGRPKEKGCFCCGKIGHKLKRCPYKCLNQN